MTRAFARIVPGVVVTVMLLFAASAATALPADSGKRRPKQIWHGYGYLPGYRPPDQLEWQKARNRAPYFWYGYPQFYRGRWNGGGFGPCWTQTPIGNVWNCGK